MANSRVWLVTGSSSGFGRAVVEHALGQGDKVVATLRNPGDLLDLTTKYSAEQILVLKLDVTDPSAIRNVFTEGHKSFGRIDIVFNNAGWGIIGEVEGTPNDLGHDMFETNFWGAAHVSREAVRYFREISCEGGRLLQNSSIWGVVPLPGLGYFSASKFAIEGLTQALMKELDPKWNIKVTIIDAGSFKTNGSSNSRVIPTHAAYAASSLPSEKMRRRVQAAASTPGRDVSMAAAKIYQLSTLPEPPTRLIIGKDAIGLIRDQFKSILGDIDQFESWSDDL